jgi:uncharacterized protein (UPF0332 family)
MTQLWNKARQSAAGARVLFAAGLYDDACSRAYYAMFNAARELLAGRGIDAERVKTHQGVLRQFSAVFVQSGLFDEDDGRALRRAGETRNVADYDSFAGAGLDRAQATMNAMEKFMATAERVFAQEGGGL